MVMMIIIIMIKYTFCQPIVRVFRRDSAATCSRDDRVWPGLPRAILVAPNPAMDDDCGLHRFASSVAAVY